MELFMDFVLMSLLVEMFFDDSWSDDDDDFEMASVLLADIESNKRPKHVGLVPGACGGSSE